MKELPEKIASHKGKMVINNFGDLGDHYASDFIISGNRRVLLFEDSLAPNPY